MSEQTLRRINTIGLTSAQLGLVLLAGILWGLHGFDFSELTTTLAIVFPIFIAQISLIVKHVVANKSVTYSTSPQVTGEFAYLTLLSWVVLVITIAVLMFLKAYNKVFSSFEEFKTILGIAECMLGGFMGTFIRALYGEGNK